MMENIFRLMLVLWMALSAQAYDRNTDGMVMAGKTAAPPRIDGELNDSCWRTSIEITPFQLVRQERFATEQTSVRIAYDADNLYLAFECRAGCLVPAANIIHEFKNEKRDRNDDRIWQVDDCVLFLFTPDLKKPDVVYEFFISGSGAVTDARCRGPKFWDTRDKSWNSGIRVATRTDDDGKWTVEAAIPLKDIDFMPDRTAGIVLGRMERSRGEQSAWQPVTVGFHDLSSFAALKFADAVPGIGKVRIPEFEPGSNALQVAFQPTGGLDRLQIRQSLRFQGKRVANVWKNFSATTPAEFAADFNLDDSGSLQYRWSYLDPANLTAWFNSPEYRLSTTTSSLSADLKGGKIEMFVNGNAVANARAPMIKGNNVIAIRYADGISGNLNANGFSMPLDENWKYSETETKDWQKPAFNDASWQAARPENGVIKGSGFLRKTVISDGTMIWPNWEKEGITMTAGGIQPLLCIPHGVRNHVLNDYTLHLDLPGDFMLKGASSYYNKYKFRLSEPRPIVINNRQFNRYSAVFDQPISFRERLPIYECFVFMIKAPKNAASTENELYFHASSESAAIAEIPQKIKINLLPELNGSAPEKVLVQMWPGWFHALTDENLKEELVSEMIRMGVNETRLASDRIGQFRLISFDTWNFDCTPHLKQNPGHARKDEKGKAYPDSYPYICPGKMLGDPAAMRFLREGMEPWLKKHGYPRHINWDYESDVFTSYLTCYCDSCLEEFRQTHKVKTADLTPAVIRERYAPKWTEFMNVRMAEMAGMLRASIKTHSPSTVFSVYSGYQSDFTSKGYGVDWSLLKGKIDMAMCGYGRPLEQIADTLAAIGSDVPLITGLISTPYQIAKRDFPTAISEAALMRMLCDGTGGVLVYDMNTLDGRTFSALGNFTRFVADNETFFAPMKKAAIPTIAGFQEEHLAVLENDTRKLLLLINNSRANRRFQITPAVFPGYGRMIDMTTGREIKTLEDTLPPGKFRGILFER